MIGAIVGEFFVGYGDKGFGLGYLIRSAAESYQTASLFAAVILSTLLGVIVFAAVGLVSEWVFDAGARTEASGVSAWDSRDPARWAAS